jgi:hypothetical protein
MLATNVDSVATTPLVITKVTMWSTNTTTPSIVYLYDGWRLQTNTAYTNYTAARTAQVTSYITTTGLTNLMTNYVYKTTANAVSAGSAVQTPTATFIVPANSVAAPFVFDETLNFGQRLSLSNSAAGLDYVIEYRSP